MTLEDAASLASHERGLVVISTLRPNGTIQSSLVIGEQSCDGLAVNNL